MSIRVTIAKWLAPSVFSSNDDLKEEATRYFLISQKFNYNTEIGERRTLALRDIAALRTPKCANVGKRMADIAEEALK